MSLDESKRYIKDYEELIKQPGYVPTPTMKERYEAEKAAVGNDIAPLDTSDPLSGGAYGWPYAMPGIIWGGDPTGWSKSILSVSYNSDGTIHETYEVVSDGLCVWEKPIAQWVSQSREAMREQGTDQYIDIIGDSVITYDGKTAMLSRSGGKFVKFPIDDGDSD